MFNIKISDNKNILNFFIIIFLISSCSSMNITEEVVYDGGVSSVEAKIQEEYNLDYQTKAIFTNATVYFEFDKFNLKDAQIESVVAFVKKIDTSRVETVEIFGYCDDRGKDEYNYVLSTRRANTVKDKLVERGIKSKIIIINLTFRSSF